MCNYLLSTVLKARNVYLASGKRCQNGSDEVICWSIKRRLQNYAVSRLGGIVPKRGCQIFNTGGGWYFLEQMEWLLTTRPNTVSRLFPIRHKISFSWRSITHNDSWSLSQTNSSQTNFFHFLFITMSKTAPQAGWMQLTRGSSRPFTFPLHNSNPRIVFGMMASNTRGRAQSPCQGIDKMKVVSVIDAVFGLLDNYECLSETDVDESSAEQP